jgi:hypothetical protein
MEMLTEDDAKRAILREWLKLPETERGDQAQRAKFALEMSNKYPFQSSGDCYQLIMGWLYKI